ncbi:MAG: DUF86 domain-containing protein [Firmicutes bacterium]|jgi:uncharacterized protein YutE (UPF0331/DUF86 family)|nr:DUF86 domain-containing protein [Bacillota bacterium]
MLNHVLIEERLALMAGYLRELEIIAKRPQGEFLQDRILSGAAESYLRRSLEVVFDIGRHILSKSGATELAGEFKGIARGLAERGVVGAELGQRLVQMTGYRNRLVHLYNQVTDQELYGIITNDLADLRAFIREIRDYVARCAADHRD